MTVIVPVPTIGARKELAIPISAIWGTGV